MKKSISLLMTLILMAVPIAAQNIGETLKTLAADNAKLYVAPLPTSLGMAMNSATFQRARPHKILGFDVTVSVGWITIPNDKRTFEFVIPDIEVEIPLGATNYPLTLDGNALFPDREAQNLFGANVTAEFFEVDRAGAHDEIVTKLRAANVDEAVIAAADAVITSAANLIPNIPKPTGILSGVFPLFVPQISIGLPMGLEVSLRGGIDVDIPKFGNVSLTGLGGKISINQFIPTIPLVFPALSVGFYSTTFSLDTEFADIEATNSVINFQISKSIPFLMAYAGVGLESSSLDVGYSFSPGDGVEPIEDSFKLDGDNSFRTTVGFRLKLGLLTVHGAAVSGEYSGLYGGLGLTFR